MICTCVLLLVILTEERQLRFHHATACNAMHSIAVTVLSIRPSVCYTRVLWQNSMMHCGYFDTTWKGNHSSFLGPTLVGGRCPFPVKYSPKVTHPLYPIRETSMSYAFRRWHFARVILAWWIALESCPAQNHWQCWQLHNGLIGHRQSHSLSATAEQLVMCWHSQECLNTWLILLRHV